MRRGEVLLIAALLGLGCQSPGAPGADTDGPLEDELPGDSSGSGSSTTEADVGPDSRCGDGVADDGEDCDLGVGNEVGLDCTSECRLPRCGDGRLAPGEDCDGSQMRQPTEISPAACSDGCRWVEPTQWRDDWSTHDGHDDAVTRVVATEDERIVALGWQGVDWSIRQYEADGTVSSATLLGPVDCSYQIPRMAALSELAAVLMPNCGDGFVELWAFDASGDLAWSVELPESADGAAGGLWSTAEGFVAYTVHLIDPVEEDYELRLTAFDDAGNTGWSSPIEHVVRSIASDGDLLFGASSETLWTRRLDDGSLVDVIPLRSRSARIALDGEARPVLLRQPTNPFDPFVLEALDRDLSQRWSVPFEDLPDVSSNAYGLDAQGDRLAIAFEDDVEGLGAFDTAATVRTYDLEGQAGPTFQVRGSDHGRDVANDVALLPDGGVVIGGALARAHTGRDGYVARLDESLATSSTYVAPHRTRRGPEPIVRPAGQVAKTVYVDVSGPFLRSGTDPAGAEFTCVDGPFGLPALSWSPEDVEVALERAREIVEPFAIRLVDDEPPAYLPYTRVVVGGAPEDLGTSDGHQGLACSVDCGDRTWVESVFVFGETAPSPQALAQTIVHELGHAIGLDHVDVDDALMNPVAGDDNIDIVDACQPTIEGLCASEHADTCPAGQQNAYAEFMAAVGPNRTDSEPPQIVLEAADAEVREEVRVHVEVSDASAGFGWELRVLELGWVSVGSTAEVADENILLPEGRWTLEVEASDQLGNVSTAQATVEVG